MASEEGKSTKKKLCKISFQKLLIRNHEIDTFSYKKLEEESDIDEVIDDTVSKTNKNDVNEFLIPEAFPTEGLQHENKNSSKRQGCSGESKSSVCSSPPLLIYESIISKQKVPQNNKKGTFKSDAESKGKSESKYFKRIIQKPEQKAIDYTTDVTNKQKKRKNLIEAFKTDIYKNMSNTESRKVKKYKIIDLEEINFNETFTNVLTSQILNNDKSGKDIKTSTENKKEENINHVSEDNFNINKEFMPRNEIDFNSQGVVEKNDEGKNHSIMKNSSETKGSKTKINELTKKSDYLDALRRSKRIENLNKINFFKF